MKIKYPKKIIITEVGPRDGLQNEKIILPTEDKIAFIEALVKAGVKRIEATSFVAPTWVPQLADAAIVFAQLNKIPGVQYIVLVPNLKGLKRALDVGVKDLAVFTAASDAFNQKNINMTTAQSLVVMTELINEARQNKVASIRAYLSTAFECPYAGKTNSSLVIELVKQLLDLNVDEISIGDTIGVAAPLEVQLLLEQLLKFCPADKLAMHFHNTKGTALANTLMAMQMGISKFDSSAGGLGGCPYAPGASGNLATEALLYLATRMGISTGINLEQCQNASRVVLEKLGRNSYIH